jgi:urease accessory protein
MSTASLLLLADARFPDGTHAHSYGLEAAVADGRIRDTGDLASYIESRLWSTGRTDATAAALATRGNEPLEVVDAALVVRTPSEAARTTSRSLGRSLLRSAARLWPETPVPLVGGQPPMQPVAMGAVGAIAGCTPIESALVVTHGLVGALSTAALRLLGLDPFEVSRVCADMRASVEAVATEAAGIDSTAGLPHCSTPFSEIDPEMQQMIQTRLFGS